MLKPLAITILLVLASLSRFISTASARLSEATSVTICWRGHELSVKMIKRETTTSSTNFVLELLMKSGKFSFLVFHFVHEND